jgi:hypothetical protein
LLTTPSGDVVPFVPVSKISPDINEWSSEERLSCNEVAMVNGRSNLLGRVVDGSSRGGIQ